jgi:hypothetical protein
MTGFSLLVFQGPRLVASDQFDAPTVVAAIEACSGRHKSLRMELWADGKLAARLGPAIGRHEDDG